MFSMLTSRMKSGLASWWSKVTSASPADRHHRVEVVDVDRLLGGADAGVRVLEHGDVELLLAAEVVVDHPLGGAGAGADLVDPGAVVPPLGELGGRTLRISARVRSASRWRSGGPSVRPLRSLRSLLRPAPDDD
jgi:hypothetical protein